MIPARIRLIAPILAAAMAGVFLLLPALALVGALLDTPATATTWQPALASCALAAAVGPASATLAAICAATTRLLWRRGRVWADALIFALLGFAPFTLATVIRLLTTGLPLRAGVLAGGGILVTLTLATLPVPYLLAIRAWRGIDPQLWDIIRLYRRGSIRPVLAGPVAAAWRLGACLAGIEAASSIAVPLVWGGHFPFLAQLAYSRETALADSPGAARYALALIGLAALFILIFRPLRAASLLRHTTPTLRPWRVDVTMPGSRPTNPGGAGARFALPALLRIVLHLVTGAVLAVLATCYVQLFAQAVPVLTRLVWAEAGARILPAGLRAAFGVTVIAAAIITALALAGGGASGWLVANTRRPYLGWAASLLLFLPAPVIGVAWGIVARSPWHVGPVTVFPQLSGTHSTAAALVAICAVGVTQVWPLMHLLAVLIAGGFTRQLALTSATLGVDRWRTFRQVTIPLLRPWLGVIATIGCGRVLTLVTPMLFVSSSSAPLIQPAIFDITDNLMLAEALALALITAALVGALAGLGRLSLRTLTRIGAPA